MEFDSFDEIQKFAKQNPIQFLNMSGKEKIDITCSKCNNVFELKLPTELEIIKCVNCGEVIDLNISLE